MTTANLAVADNETVIQYTSTGESEFAYPFPILDGEELKVSIDQQLQTEGAHYTVDGEGDAAGGTVTFLSPTTAGQKVTLWLEMPIKRLTGFALGAAVLLPQALNTEFVRQVRVDQMLRRDIARCLRIPVDDPESAQILELPTATARASKFLRFDANGVPSVAETLDPAQTLSQDTIAQYLKARTDDEISAGVVPSVLLYDELDPVRYGAAADAATDDYTAIMRAISVAQQKGGLVYVDLRGRRYASATGVVIPTNVVLTNGEVIYTGNTADTAVIQAGVTGGGPLTRPAGAENLKASTTSTATGITGFRFEGLVRSSWFRNCFASMNEDGTGTRGHVGYEIIADTIANATDGLTGAYQNEIKGCTAYNAHTAVRIKTRGNTATQLSDPQANANRVDVWAYACIARALVIEEGALENHVRVRADSFVTQTGEGTTIYVADIGGQFNDVVLDEEIGPRADTQYSVRLRADAAYNVIDYHSQNVVTARVLNQATGHRNILRWRRPTQNLGGNLAGSHHYTLTAISASANQEIRDVWIAPAPCVLVRAAAKLDANVATSGTFYAYVAKNGTYTANNRIEFAVGEGTTTKYLDGDTSTSTPIDANLVLAKGDALNIAFSNSSPDSIKCAVSWHVRFLSTESNG